MAVNKSKYALGGAMSGAAAGTAVLPGWGTAIGAVAGGLMGLFQAPDEREKKKQLEQSLIDKLANQALGNEATASELNLRQAFDKTLAQQVAAARASRGVNPALQSRNIARMASETAAQAAAESAKLAVQERTNSFDKYMKAIQYNNDVMAYNSGVDQESAKASDMALANGLNATAGMLVQGAQARDAGQRKDNMALYGQDRTDAEMKRLSEKQATVDAAKNLNQAMTMGAQQDAQPTQTFQNPFQSNKLGQTPDMTVVSDERQKDLIKKEDLPNNSAMNQQVQSAQAPQGAPSQTQPIMNQQAANTQAAPVTAPAVSQPVVTPDMLTAAQASSKKGGNVSDISNVQNTLKKPGAITEEEKAQLWANAQAEERRQDTADNAFWGRNKSAGTLFGEYLAQWNAANAENIAKYNREQSDVDSINKARALERSSRLANFYTGQTNTTPNDIAQGYAAFNRASKNNVDIGNAAQQEQERLKQLVALSDENTKTEVKKGNMSPKSFLDKLSAYSYEYKDSAKENLGAPQGRHLGVMAQDLEKAGPVGQQMVKEDPATGVKTVDYGQGFGAILASQVELNKRLKEIEKKYKGGK